MSKVRFRFALLSSFLGLHAAALPVLAQTPAQLPGESAAWLSWVVGAGVAVVILLPAFLNPKRSHLT